MAIDSTHLENDEFGYSCYTVVIPAPGRLLDPLLVIERDAGQERAKIPAHVTVKGTFHAISSLNLVIKTIREVAASHEPFLLETVGMETWDSDHSVILGFPINPNIQSLHDGLVSAIAPIGTTVYPDDPYKVHMSIVNEVKPAGVKLAKDRLEAIDFTEDIQVNSIDLMARDGVAWGGAWHRLERFTLGSA